MKKVIIISLSLLAFSCTKTWNCTIITSTTTGVLISKDIEFEGTKEEVKQFEEDFTKTMSLYDGGTLTQTTDCK